MKVLVAGGAGFIGSHLTDALLGMGHQVICVDNFSLGKEKNISHLKGRQDYILYREDICDIKILEDIFRKNPIDYVFHLAANSDIQASAKEPQIEYKNTYTTTYALLECMRKFEVKRIFFASTSAVYGNKPGVTLDENTPDLRPISYYGAAKLGSEGLISAYSYMNDMKALIFRFPNVIGPRLTHGVIFDFVGRLRAEGRRLRILGDGKQTKPYLHVSDLVRAITDFMETAGKGITLYNVGVDSATSVTRIADILCEEMGLNNVEYQYTGGEGGWKGDVPRFRYCLDKIHRAGWKARYTSDEAVQETVKAYLKEN